MIRTARASVQLAIAAFMICSPIVASTAAEDAVTNKDVAKYLTEAKKLAGGKRWDAAWAALEKAERVPDASPYAEYKIDEFKGYVLTQQHKYAEAGAIFEQLAKSASAATDERTNHLKTASQLYMKAKLYDKSAHAAEAALEQRRNDPELLQLAGQAKYLAGDFTGAAADIRQLVAVAEHKGDKPQEEWLQILLNSYYRLNDREQVAQTRAMLLRNYSKPQYWKNVLALKDAESHSDPVEFYYLALTFDVGALDDPADYEALALGAIDLGLPEEAVRVLQAGLEKGVLTGADEPRFRRMLTHAQAETRNSAAATKDLAEQARHATTGQPDAEVGRAYLSQQKYDQAIAALRRAIEKGELRHADQARIDLGIAYLRRGEAQQASESFNAVKADSEWRDLAELWSVRASEVAQSTAQRNETAQR